jgi:TolB protein
MIVRKEMHKFSFIFLFLLVVLIGLADRATCQDKFVIDLDKPATAKLPIAIPDFQIVSPVSFDSKELSSVLKNDLSLSNLFDVVQSNIPASQGSPDFQQWSQSGAQMLVTGHIEINGDELTFDGRLFDVALKRMELGKKYTGKISDGRRIMHKFADRILEKVTGVPGCFSSKIVFSGEAGDRELYIMDFDGQDLKKLTRNGSINLSPDWSPDSRSILFTSYVNSNPDLWRLDLNTLTQFPVSSRPGLNASGRYSPDGNHIALALNFNGIPKLFIINNRGDVEKRLTDGRGNDISPSWSPDGSTIAYVSDQAGSPNIYLVSVATGQTRRLTVNTNYNTDPDWSPKGDLIAFTARVDGRFQVCTIKPDGSDMKVLTSMGTNQDPAWSPDGRLIAFTSNRDGRKAIYVMDSNGRTQWPIARMAGKSPAWSRSF